MFDRRAALRLFVALAGAFAAASVVVSATSRGFLEGDGITHFQYARWATAYPWMLTDVWGRPAVTLLHLPGAQLPGTAGLVAVRLTSLIAALVAAVAAWRIVRESDGEPWAPLAGAFALCGPMTFLHASAVLTELPFAAMSALCLLAYARRRWFVLALLAGALPAARPEGIAFALIAAGGLALHRRWLALPLILAAPLLWSIAGWLIEGRPATGFGPLGWLAMRWPYSGTSTYEPGPIWTFAYRLPVVVGPLLVPFVLVGLVVSFRRPFDHAGRVRLLSAGLPLLVLVTHSVLFWLGKAASSGDVRYLVAVAPFWGIIAARGFAATAGWMRPRRPVLMASVVAVASAVGSQIVYPVVPFVMDEDARSAEAVAAWWRGSDLRPSSPTCGRTTPCSASPPASRPLPAADRSWWSRGRRAWRISGTTSTAATTPTPASRCRRTCRPATGGPTARRAIFRRSGDFSLAIESLPWPPLGPRVATHRACRDFGGRRLRRRRRAGDGHGCRVRRTRGERR